MLPCERAGCSVVAPVPNRWRAYALHHKGIHKAVTVTAAPDVTAWDLGRALLVGVLLGVLGGLSHMPRVAHNAHPSAGCTRRTTPVVLRLKRERLGTGGI